MGKRKKEAPANQYERLDPVLAKEITDFIIDKLREEETKLVKARHDHKRANVKLLLRKYRGIVENVSKSVYDAVHIEDDVELLELIEMMSGKRESFRVESLRDSAARSQMLVAHIDRMIAAYKDFCDKSDKEEDKRRYRVVYDSFISPNPKTTEEIAAAEHIDKSTIYRDIDAAADRLAVLFFGVYGLKFL